MAEQTSELDRTVIVLGVFMRTNPRFGQWTNELRWAARGWMPYSDQVRRPALGKLWAPSELPQVGLRAEAPVNCLDLDRASSSHSTSKPAQATRLKSPCGDTTARMDEPIQLSLPLPRSLDTRIYLQLTIRAKSITLFVTTATSEEAGAPTPLGSFVYAIPDVGSHSMMMDS